MIGPRQLAEHERVEPIGLPARGTEPITSRRNLVGMQGKDPQPGLQQPLDQQPVGRSIATSVTSWRTSARHKPRTPASSCANVAARSLSPVSSAITTSCFSDAQSTPA